MVGVARVLPPDAGGIGHHRHDLLAHALGRFGDADRVVVRLRHLPGVDPVDLRGRRVESLRLRENRTVEAVEAANDLAADFEVARLVLAHRDQVGAVDGDVGRHEHRVTQEPVRGEVARPQRIDLVLVGRHAFQPAERRDHREVERELRVLRHARLQKDRGLLRVEPDRQPVENGVARVRGERLGVGIVGRQRVEVGDEEETSILPGVLKIDPVLDGSEVVAEVDAPGRSEPGQDDRVRHGMPRKTIA